MPTKKKGNNKRKKIFWISLFVSILALITTFFWLDSGNFILNRNDPDRVVLVFTLALMRNRERQAKSLIAEETWPQLDAWFETHPARNCHFLDGDYYILGGSNRSYDSELNQYFYEYSTIQHPCSGALYFLAVKNITVAQDKHGWQIVHWEAPCDASGFNAKGEFNSKECYPWE
ncbi:MAG: hypothetical protein H6657_28170 [Ardenticatenaceae bacterium]|nr:hypothetical protein [Ardenticatenaceae bacterium]